jgi:hypothetical protein
VALLPCCRHRPDRNGPRVISVTQQGAGGFSGHGGPGAARSLSRPVRTGADPQNADRWCRTRGSPPAESGSTATRSKRSGRAGTVDPFGSGAPSNSAYAARRRCARLRWSTVSSANPKSRLPRQRTSTITSIGGGPGSTATRSSSWRPTWMFRARMVQPASLSRAPTRASAVSPASCAVVRVRAEGRPSTSSMLPAGAHPVLTRQLFGPYVVASSSESRSARSRAASSAMTGRYSRSSSSWVIGEAAGSPSRSRSS